MTTQVAWFRWYTAWLVKNWNEDDTILRRKKTLFESIVWVLYGRFDWRAFRFVRFLATVKSKECTVTASHAILVAGIVYYTRYNVHCTLYTVQCTCTTQNRRFRYHCARMTRLQNIRSFFVQFFLQVFLFRINLALISRLCSPSFHRHTTLDSQRHHTRIEASHFVVLSVWASLVVTVWLIVEWRSNSLISSSSSPSSVFLPSGFSPIASLLWNFQISSKADSIRVTF